VEACTVEQIGGVLEALVDDAAVPVESSGIIDPSAAASVRP